MSMGASARNVNGTTQHAINASLQNLSPPQRECSIDNRCDDDRLTALKHDSINHAIDVPQQSRNRVNRVEWIPQHDNMVMWVIILAMIQRVISCKYQPLIFRAKRTAMPPPSTIQTPFCTLCTFRYVRVSDIGYSKKYYTSPRLMSSGLLPLHFFFSPSPSLPGLAFFFFFWKNLLEILVKNSLSFV